MLQRSFWSFLKKCANWVGDCDFVDPDAVISNGGINLRGETYKKSYTQGLYDYIKKNGSKYDVIDYEHQYLPYKVDLPQEPLYVARSVLLVHHFKNIKIPMTFGSYTVKNNIRSQIKGLIFSPLYKKQLETRINLATKTCMEADLVNVPNYNDKSVLVQSGVEEDKITVIPFGMNESRRKTFDKIADVIPLNPSVVFVGTFDNRKGATDIPKIFKNILEYVPEAKLHLLGAKGFYQTKDQILSHFEKSLYNRINIVKEYNPDDLPSIIKNCTIGIFPSYIEGFPFAVLEMLSAGIPVVAYNSPGAPMMLPKDYLVSPGDINGMSKKIIELLHDHEKLKSAKINSIKYSKEFSWETAARKTSDIYIDSIKFKNNL